MVESCGLPRKPPTYFVEAALAGELQREVLLHGAFVGFLARRVRGRLGAVLRAAGGEDGQAGEQGDAVVGVDDVVALGDVQEGVHRPARADPGDAPAHGRAVEQLAGGDDGGARRAGLAVVQRLLAPDHAAADVEHAAFDVGAGGVQRDELAQPGGLGV
jgi:hypothetical protein